MDEDGDLTAPRPFKTTDILILMSAGIAFFMNLLTFLNLLGHRKLRKNKYFRAVLSLSIGDMIASFFAVHWFIRRFWIHPDPTSDTECLICFIAICSSLQQTHLQMLLLAVERYLTSKGTITSQRYCTLNVQVFYMAFSWIFCVGYMLANSLNHKMKGANLCQNGQFAFFVDSYARIGVVFVTPIMVSIFVVLFLYSLTILNIRRSSKRVGDSIHPTSQQVSTSHWYVKYNRLQSSLQITRSALLDDGTSGIVFIEMFYHIKATAFHSNEKLV